MKNECPMPGEEKFFRKIQNRAPQDVAKIMAKEFIRRFQPDCDLDYVLERLQPCLNFAELDLRIRNFTVLRRPEPLSDNQQRFWPVEALEASTRLREAREVEHDFWDAMRFLLHPLTGAESAAKNMLALRNMGFLRVPKTAEEIEMILEDQTFSRLSGFQKSKIRHLLISPAAGELDFFQRIWGRTPSQVAKLMATEFVERFAPEHASGYLKAEEVYDRLCPSHRWAELDLRISLYVREKWWAAGDEAEATFWDDMRYLLKALPRHKYTIKPESLPRQPGKLSPGLAAYPELIERAKLSPADLVIIENWAFEDCEFCWRWVPISVKSAKRPTKILCPEHRSLSPEDSQYRKCQRLYAEAQALAFDLEQELRPAYPPTVRDQDAFILAQDLFFMADPKSPLDHVRAYLSNHGKGSSDLAVLIWALNAPDREDLEPPARKALDWRIREHLNYPTLALMNQLALAEAWLRLMNRDRRYKN